MRISLRVLSLTLLPFAQNWPVAPPSCACAMVEQLTPKVAWNCGMSITDAAHGMWGYLKTTQHQWLANAEQGPGRLVDGKEHRLSSPWG